MWSVYYYQVSFGTEVYTENKCGANLYILRMHLYFHIVCKRTELF